MRRPPGDIRISPADLEVEYQARLEAERERDRYREALERTWEKLHQETGEMGQVIADAALIVGRALADQEQER